MLNLYCSAHNERVAAVELREHRGCFYACRYGCWAHAAFRRTTPQPPNNYLYWAEESPFVPALDYIEVARANGCEIYGQEIVAIGDDILTAPPDPPADLYLEEHHAGA